MWASVKENVINPFSDLLPRPILAGVSTDSPAAPEDNQQPSTLQVVIVLDVNPNQGKVFALESALETGILDHLAQRDAAVSLVTFGSREPVLRIAYAKPSDAIDTITNINLEQSGEKYFAVHLYEAMDLALKQFKDDARPKSFPGSWRSFSRVFLNQSPSYQTGRH